MKRLPTIILATLALGGTALAAEQPGASGNAPGHEMKKDDGKMKGPPNASGFDKDGKSGSTGSTSSGSGSSGSSGGTSSKPQ